MIIEKPTIERIVAFTLAEVLVTMIIIVLMTLASIPVIKKSKEYRDAAKDRNIWMAFYDQNDELKVYVDGSERSDLVEGSGDDAYAKFEPPEGVTRFNVTVIGGGGGGAAGEAGIGEVKTFGYRENEYVQTFIPASDGIYQILAIGCGGGGGGGGAMCEGGGAYSGGAIIQQAKLRKGNIYAVTVGKGADGGKPQTIGNFLGDVFMPVVVVGSFVMTIVTAGLGTPLLMTATGWFWTTYGVEIAAAIRYGTQSYDRKQGGGNGLPSTFNGEGVNVIAAGGGGGKHERKKGFWPKCKGTGGCQGENANGNCKNIVNPDTGEEYGITTDMSTHADGENLVGSEIVKLNSQEPGEGRKRKEGYICAGAGDCKQNLQRYFGNDGLLWPYGNGGTGGARHRKGYPGTNGIVQVTELPAFGGGAGSPGAISFYSYTKSPLSTKQEKEDGFIKVYPGKGGDAGVSAGADGKDGQFSRFGTRIIADGGKGGAAGASTPASDDNAEEIEAPGENGIMSAIPTTLREKIKYPSGAEQLEDVFGGLQEGHSGSCSASPEGLATNSYYNSDYNGYGLRSCKSNYYPVPGSGGAGGGAQGSRDTLNGDIGWGVGGKGAHGIVIVTW